jgi:hypothetical protein
MSVFIGRGMLQSFSAFFLLISDLSVESAYGHLWGNSGCFFHHAAILVLFTIVNSLSVSLGDKIISWGNDHFFFPDSIFEVAGQP